MISFGSHFGLPKNDRLLFHGECAFPMFHCSRNAIWRQSRISRFSGFTPCGTFHFFIPCVRLEYMAFQLTPQAQRALTKLGVMTLYLFGSRAQNAETARSDYDFAVLMKHPGHKRGDAPYDAIYDIFAPLCPRTLENDVIDIVFLHDASLELRNHVLQYGKIFLDNDPKQRVQFVEKTMLEYCDFRPLLDMFDNAILSSL